MSKAKRVIISNSIWLFAEKAILMSFGLAVSIVLARYLGPEAFGSYNFIISFVALFAPLFSLGMTNPLLREYAHRPGRISDIIRTCFQSCMLASIALSAIGLFVFWNLYGFGWKFQLLGILLIANITNAFEVYERWFQHKSLNQLLVKWRVFCFTVFAALKLIAAVYFESFFILICIFAVEVIVKNYGYKVLYVHVKKQTEKGEYDTKLFSEIFSQTKYLIFSGVASVVYLKIDILMLESMVDSQEAGIYAVASRISEIWYIFPQVVLIALFPKLLEIAKTSNEKYLRLLQLGFDLLFVIALSLSAFIFAVSPYLIELLYGEQYRASSLILQVHIFASVFIYMRVLLSQWLVSEQFAQFSLFSQISGAVSNILLNLWLIPIYGAMGAAIATLISYAITAYVCLLFHNRTHKIALMMTKSFLFPFRIFHIYRNIKQIMS